MHTYYVESNGSKDGPHDLVSLMRRIQAKKIGPGTLIYIDGAETPVAARDIDDLASFFSRPQEDVKAVRQVRPVPTLGSLLATGWRFTMENNVMTVFSGGLLLMTIMLASGLIHSVGFYKGILISWVTFGIFHNFYLLFVLRLYREQPITSSFINQQMVPVLWPLIFASAILSLMMAGGLLLLVLPCMLVAIFYVFVPFLIFDKRYGPIRAMKESRVLLQKRDPRYRDSVSALVVLHLVSMMLIIPMPLTLPIFAAALAELYEALPQRSEHHSRSPR